MKLTQKLTFLALMFFNICQAQNLEWGVLNESNSMKFTPNILHSDESGVYVVAYDFKKFYVEKYDQNKYKLIYSKEIELPEINDRKTIFENISFIDKKFIVFCSTFDKEKDNAALYSFSIDADNGKKIGKNLMLLELPVEKKRRKGEFYVVTSEDKTKILVNHQAYYKKERKYRNNYVLFDADLEVLLKREDIKEVDQDNYLTYNYLIDNDGSIYFIKRYNQNESFLVSYNANADYEKWEEAIDISSLKPNSKVTNVHVSINEKENLVLVGYYKKEYDYKGLFFIEMDKVSKEVVKNKLTEFSQADVEKLNTIRKKANRQNAFNIVNHYHQKDGSMILMGESYERYFIHSNYGTTVVTNYLDIIITKVNSDGSIAWVNRIPKTQMHAAALSLFRTMRQVTKECEYFSYMFGMNDDKILLAYNDHVKNLSKTSVDEKYKRFKKLAKSVPVIVSINQNDGSLTKTKFYDSKTEGYIFKPQIFTFNPDKKEIVTFAQKFAQYKFGTVKIN